MKKWVLYPGVLLIAVIAGCYFLNPADRLSAWLTRSMSNNSPDAVFSCDAGRLVFPPGLTLDRFRIDSRGRPDSRIETEALTLNPKLRAFLFGRLSLLLRTELYGGHLDGELDYLRYFTAAGPLRASINAGEIDIGQCSYLRALTGKPLKGKLKGTLNFTGDSADLLRGTGQAHLIIQECYFPVAGNLTGSAMGYFDSLEAQIVFDQGTLQIRQLTLSGQGFRSVLKGHILLKDDLRTSILSLAGKLDAPGSSRLQFNYAITGTVSEPVITVM